MPQKIAIDLEYERSRTFLSDLRLLKELIFFIVCGRSDRIDLEFSVHRQPTRVSAELRPKR